MAVYFSELNVWSASAGGDFAEIVAPQGTDLSGYSVYVYDDLGAIVSGPWSLGAVENTVAGNDIYVIDQPSDGIELSLTSSIALVDDTGTVVQFLGVGSRSTTATEGPASGMTSTPLGAVTSGEVYQSNDGNTYTTSTTSSKGTVPCFAEGTWIDTPMGQTPVQCLAVGDPVRTVDGANAMIVFARAVTVACTPTSLPVLIRAGALGANAPSHDLIVSGNHRVLVGVPQQLGDIFAGRALVPAKALTKLPGIRLMAGKRWMTWHHFAFARHDVVFSNGCATETLLLGAMARQNMNRTEIAALRQVFSDDAFRFPALNGPARFPCLTAGQTRKIASPRGKRRAALRPSAKIHDRTVELPMDSPVTRVPVPRIST